MQQISMLDDLTREVRFGIVLYGGVSLAVYENGVVQKLFRAVKGSGIYTVIKQLTGCDLVLDIISGTSAGGINGILLGYALANDCDISVTEDFWREEGDILNLLHAPGDAAPNSILNSRGYYQPRLEEAFTAIKRKDFKPAEGDLVSEIGELDVFITGTNVYGHVYTEFDEFGHAIDVKDHRSVFHLRQRIENDFMRDVKAYAKLARITSCFPVAFEPVEINSQRDDRAEVEADSLLINWGNLAREKDADGKEIPSFFLDGGILDNKPFSSTLSAIFHHTQTRQVDRFLVYVEPDPERFRISGEPKHTSPNVLRAAGDGLSRIPGYQSIAADLAAIAEHNSRVRQYRELADTLNTVTERLISGHIFGAPAEMADLDQPLEQSNDQIAQTIIQQQASIYRRSRFSLARDRVIDSVLKQNGQRRLLKDKERQAGELLVKAFDDLPQERILKSLQEFDVYYRMRRLFFIADRISDLINDGSIMLSTEAKKTYRDVWCRINNRIKRLEIIKSKMEELIDRVDFPWQKIIETDKPAEAAMEIWAAVESLLGRLLDPAGMSQEAVIAEDKPDQKKLYEVLDGRVRKFLDPFDPLSAQPQDIPGSKNLLLEGDADEFALLGNSTPGKLHDPVTQHYCRFVYADSYLFPIQYTSKMESTDEARTMRISPIDANLGFSSNQQKLCGDELWHFGGFLKSSWRANDLMWGRLDGACQLIQCVVTRDRLRRLEPEERKKVIATLRKRSPSGAEFLADIEKQLENFANADSGAAEKDSFDFDKLLNALVNVGQSQIIQEEVPKVIEASIAQQGAWNQYDLTNLLSTQFNPNASKPAGKPANANQSDPPSTNEDWRAGARQPDRTVTNYAAIRFVEEPSRDWVKYFREQYTVAGERWQNGIPRPVLIEIVATMMLVLRKSLLAIGENGEAIRRSAIFRVGSLPLQIAYSLTRLQRRAPEYVINIVTGLGAVSITILGMDVYARIFLKGSPSPLLWAIPVIILLALGLVMLETWRVAVVVAALSMVALGIEVYARFVLGWHPSIIVLAWHPSIILWAIPSIVLLASVLVAWRSYPRYRLPAKVASLSTTTIWADPQHVPMGGNVRGHVS